MSETSRSGELPQIIPYLYYEDVGAALDWLVRSFGLRERPDETLRDGDGRVLHAALDLGRGIVMIGHPGAAYRCPKRTGHVAQNLYAYVDDLQRHYERAKSAGATILAEPEDTFYGDRRYGAADLEGHHWYFAQKLREVAAASWSPSGSDMQGHG